MSMLVGPRVRGCIAVALMAAAVGGCGGSGSTKPDGGSAGKDGGTAGATGGSPDGGLDSSGDSAAGTAGTGGAGTDGGGAGGAGGTGGGAGAGGSPGPTATCAKTLFGFYLQRNDGALLAEYDPPSTMQTPVLDASTGFPMTDAIDIADGAYHSCAVRGPSKAAVCWRKSPMGNVNGQLGNGTSDATGPLYRATPVLTGPNLPLANVTAISSISPEAWGLSTCAVTTEGKVYCWGNIRWIANDGAAAFVSPYAVPITRDGVTPLTGVLQISLGTSSFENYSNEPFYACALVQDASSKEVWCWGANLFGNLGTGDLTARPFPTKVVGIANPTKVMAGGQSGTTCALDDTNVRCWGANNQGQIGIGTSGGAVLAPTIVTLMGGATALGQIVDVKIGSDAVRDDVCVLASDHNAKCWGFDFQNFPTNFGVTNIVALGSVDYGAVRVLTSDGLYHIVSSQGGGSTARMPNCGLLQ